MSSGLTRCENCGAPMQVGSRSCAYCGAPNPAAPAAAPPPPDEIVQATASIRSRMPDPQRLLAYLTDALSGLGDGVARPRRSVLGSRISRLDLTLGAVRYEIRPEGPACVVERQAVAAGMPVGMKDTVPASRWPELLVLDVARTADERGLGWQAVGRILS
jgi:hypothetical protein